MLENAQGRIGVIFEFGPEGKARNAFSVNGVNDRWGLTRAAIDTVSRYELIEPPGRTLLACQTFKFELR
jgi:hypothetical protein